MKCCVWDYPSLAAREVIVELEIELKIRLAVLVEEVDGCTRIGVVEVLVEDAEVLEDWAYLWG